MAAVPRPRTEQPVLHQRQSSPGLQPPVPPFQNHRSPGRSLASRRRLGRTTRRVGDGRARTPCPRRRTPASRRPRRRLDGRPTQGSRSPAPAAPPDAPLPAPGTRRSGTEPDTLRIPRGSCCSRDQLPNTTSTSALAAGGCWLRRRNRGRRGRGRCRRGGGFRRLPLPERQLTRHRRPQRRHRRAVQIPSRTSTPGRLPAPDRRPQPQPEHPVSSARGRSRPLAGPPESHDGPHGRGPALPPPPGRCTPSPGRCNPNPAARAAPPQAPTVGPAGDDEYDSAHPTAVLSASRRGGREAASSAKSSPGARPGSPS